MRIKVGLTFIFLFILGAKLFANYVPVNINAGTTNIGIGTSTPNGAFVVMNGNMGVGTWLPSQMFDVKGTINASTLSGDGSALTSVPTSGWTEADPTNYTNLSTYNVGIGTTTPGGKLVVMNGNVGIGTWTSDNAKLTVLTGNVGIGTWVTQTMLDIVYGAERIISTGSGADNLILAEGSYPTTNRWKFRVIDRGDNTTDLGIYASDGSDTDTLVMSMAPANSNRASLFVNGNVGLGTSLSPNKLAVIGGVGIGTGASSDYVGTTVANGSLVVQNNVGIGTFAPQGGLAVTNGNLGIGTWSPNDSMYVVGNVGIGASSSYQLYPAPTNGLMVQGNVIIGTVGPSTRNLEIWNGAAFSRMNAGNAQFQHSSSRAYKMNIKPIFVADILDKMEKIGVKTYDYRPQFCINKQACRNKLGLIAEDFYPIFKRGNGRQINGNDIQMALWLGVKELSKEVQNLQDQYDSLTAENLRLKQQLQKYQASDIHQPK